MKKFIFLLSLGAMSVTFVAATIPSPAKTGNLKKHAGCGYRIVEFGVGVNCNGDTIKLGKSKGFQMLSFADQTKK